MKRVGLVLDPVFEGHDTRPGHPERPARLSAIRSALDAAGLPARCHPIAPALATSESLERVHDIEYIARVGLACASGDYHLDSMDVAICPASDGIARLAAGALIAVCDQVMDGKVDRGFAVVRPPGHHAERNVAMGFCLFNNVAVAARHLIDARGLSRVLIVDWDVHHGNGTQHTFDEAADVFYFSLHQHPFYPGTGARSETGRGAGAGTTLNCPLPEGAGDERFLAALRDGMVMAANHFRPEFVLVSAGFDAHRADPLAGLEVTTEAYAEATRIVIDVANRHAQGRLVSTLEGGYDLDALAQCATVHLQTLLDG